MMIITAILAMMAVAPYDAKEVCHRHDDIVYNYYEVDQLPRLSDQGLDSKMKESFDYIMNRQESIPSWLWESEGTIYMTLEVDATGQITSIDIIRGLCDLCDDLVAQSAHRIEFDVPAKIGTCSVSVKLYFGFFFRILN